LGAINIDNVLRVGDSVALKRRERLQRLRQVNGSLHVVCLPVGICIGPVEFEEGAGLIRLPRIEKETENMFLVSERIAAQKNRMRVRKRQIQGKCKVCIRPGRKIPCTCYVMDMAEILIHVEYVLVGPRRIGGEIESA